jgi:hypothetical protein
VLKLTPQKKSQIVLAVFFIGILLQGRGIFPGLINISSSFPVNQRMENGFCVILLFLTLMTVSLSKNARIIKIALVGLSSLMFFSSYNIVNYLGDSAPIKIQIHWLAINTAFLMILSWLIAAYYKIGAIGWKELFIALAIANTTLIIVVIN